MLSDTNVYIIYIKSSVGEESRKSNADIANEVYVVNVSIAAIKCSLFKISLHGYWIWDTNRFI